MPKRKNRTDQEESRHTWTNEENKIVYDAVSNNLNCSANDLVALLPGVPHNSIKNKISNMKRGIRGTAIEQNLNSNPGPFRPNSSVTMNNAPQSSCNSFYFFFFLLKKKKKKNSCC